MPQALIHIGKCVSTAGYKPHFTAPQDFPLLKFPQLAQRMSIVTEGAWEYLNRPGCASLLEKFNEIIIRPSGLSHAMNGPLVSEFKQTRNNWTIFGSYLYSQKDSDEAAYRAAEQVIYSLDPGAGRRVYFSMMGIEVEGMDTLQDLPNDHYSILLGIIFKKGNDEWTKIKKAIINNRPLGDARTRQDKDTRTIWVSTQLIHRLAKDPDEYRPTPRRREQ